MRQKRQNARIDEKLRSGLKAYRRRTSYSVLSLPHIHHPSQLRAAGLRLCDLRYMYESTGDE